MSRSHVRALARRVSRSARAWCRRQRLSRRGRAKRPRSRWRRGPSSFPPTRLKTLANGLQVLVVPHHEQPVGQLPPARSRRAPLQEPADRPGVASFVASLLNQGTTTKTRQADCDDRSTRRAGLLGVGSGNELTYVSGRGHQGSGRPGAGADGRHRRATRRSRPRKSRCSASRCCRPAGRLRRSRLSGRCRLRSARLRRASVRTPGRGHAGVDRAHHAGRPRRRSTARGSCPTTRCSPSSAT